MGISPKQLRGHPIRSHPHEQSKRRGVGAQRSIVPSLSSPPRCSAARPKQNLKQAMISSTRAEGALFSLLGSNLQADGAAFLDARKSFPFSLEVRFLGYPFGQSELFQQLVKQTVFSRRHCTIIFFYFILFFIPSFIFLRRWKRRPIYQYIVTCPPFLRLSLRLVRLASQSQQSCGREFTRMPCPITRFAIRFIIWGTTVVSTWIVPRAGP